MILQLFLLLLLLSCGVVEAQDIYTDYLHKTPDGKTIDICRIPDLNNILRDTAKEASESNPKMWYLDPQVGVTFITPCEKKMKEAMTEMDALLRAGVCINPHHIGFGLWERVMKECVK